MRKRDKVLNGRQSVWLVLNYYKSGQHMSIPYGCNDFVDLTYEWGMRTCMLPFAILDISVTTCPARR